MNDFTENLNSKIAKWLKIYLMAALLALFLAGIFLVFVPQIARELANGKEYTAVNSEQQQMLQRYFQLEFPSEATVISARYFSARDSELHVILDCPHEVFTRSMQTCWQNQEGRALYCPGDISGFAGEPRFSQAEAAYSSVEQMACIFYGRDGETETIELIGNRAFAEWDAFRRAA